jgi:hypothetical protein
LNEKELGAIHNLNLSDDKELEEIRDVFIVGCFTGLRYSDLSTLSPEHIDTTHQGRQYAGYESIESIEKQSE